MSDWIIGGSLFILGVVATTAVEWLTGKAVGALVRERFKRRARQRLRRFGRDDDLIRFSGEALYIHQFAPGGFNPDCLELVLKPPRDAKTALSLADPALLPAPIDTIVEAIEARRRHYDNPQVSSWNGRTVAVEHVEGFIRRGDDERPALRVIVSESDHAASQVCTEMWEQRFERDSGQLPATLPELYDAVPGMLHAIGLNATLVTGDRKLILTHRNPRMSSGRSGWHISVNEGLLPSDRETHSHLDPYVGLARGVKEELGITISARDVLFHTAIFDLRRYQFGLLGHIDLSSTRISAADIIEARQVGLPRDKAESTSLTVVDWTYPAVRELLAEPAWIAHGWLNLLLSAIESFPRHAEALGHILSERTESFTARADAQHAVSRLGSSRFPS